MCAVRAGDPSQGMFGTIGYFCLSIYRFCLTKYGSTVCTNAAQVEWPWPSLNTEISSISIIFYVALHA